MGLSEKDDSSGNQVFPKVTWIALDNLAQLNEIKDISNTQAVLIFKHSTRCVVSRMALKQFEKEYENKRETVNYFLDLLNFKDVSNEISATFNVKHESPQILIIKNQVSMYNVSHDDIDAEFIDKMTF